MVRLEKLIWMWSLLILSISTYVIFRFFFLFIREKKDATKVVRVNNTKLIDTGGGFFIEEDEDQSDDDMKAAVSIVIYCFACINLRICSANFSTMIMKKFTLHQQNHGILWRGLSVMV